MPRYTLLQPQAPSFQVFITTGHFTDMFVIFFLPQTSRFMSAGTGLLLEIASSEPSTLPDI